MTKRNIGWNWYSNGKRAYINLSQEVKGADGQTFEALNSHWARDNKAVYCFENPLRGADRASFEVLNDVFAKDAQRVYFLGGTIKEADASSFTVCPEHPADRGMSYAKDKSHVYFQILTIGKPRIVRHADPETFRSVGRGYGVDSRAVYFEGYRMKDAQVAQWRMLCSEIYSADDQAVFCNGNRLPGVHPHRFQVLPDGSCARDGSQYFEHDNIVPLSEYVDRLRRQFIFVGTVVDTTVVDRDLIEVPGCASIERSSNLGVRLRIHCEKVLLDPGITVGNRPVPGEAFVFHQFLAHPAMFGERIGQPWIWFFHLLNRPNESILVPNLGWRHYCPIERLDEVVGIIDELL